MVHSLNYTNSNSSSLILMDEDLNRMKCGISQESPNDVFTYHPLAFPPYSFLPFFLTKLVPSASCTFPRANDHITIQHPPSLPLSHPPNYRSHYHRHLHPHPPCYPPVRNYPNTYLLVIPPLMSYRDTSFLRLFLTVCSKGCLLRQKSQSFPLNLLSHAFYSPTYLPF